MSALSDALNRLLDPLRRQVQGMVSRVVLTRADDAHGRQEVQVEGVEGELHPVVEHFQPFGLRAVPPAGVDGVGLAVGGWRNHLVVLGLSPKMAPPFALAAGDVLLYCTAEGNYALLKADGSLKVHGKTSVRLELQDLEAHQFISITPLQTLLQVEDPESGHVSKLTITPEQVRIETASFVHP